jgi:hypothetical protein
VNGRLYPDVEVFDLVEERGFNPLDDRSYSVVHHLAFRCQQPLPELLGYDIGTYVESNWLHKAVKIFDGKLNLHDIQVDLDRWLYLRHAAKELWWDDLYMQWRYWPAPTGPTLPQFWPQP